MPATLRTPSLPRPRARRWLRAAALAAAPAFAGACGVSLTDPNTVSGTYDLAYVQGERLPAVLDYGSTYTLEATDGSLTLYPDATFDTDVRLRYRDLRGGGVSYGRDFAAGTYTVSGSRITVRVTRASGGGTFDVGDVETGTVTGNTVDIAGFTFVLR